MIASGLSDKTGVALMEGAVIERLRRDEHIELDPRVLNIGLLYESRGRAALSSIYHQYLCVGRDYGLPSIVCTPTWRASPERLQAAGYPDCAAVNQDAVHFLQAIRDSFHVYGDAIMVGGLIGCRGDAYDPADALDSKEAFQYHRTQGAALANAGVDLLLAATLPAMTEALGMARALARTACPYVLSVVVRPEGTLLDGTPLCDFVARVDREASPPPLGYAVNCVHPTNFATAMTSGNVTAATCERIIGLQANTSLLSPEELDESTHLDGAEPEEFAALMAAAVRMFGLRYVGGCCGTDARHIRAIAAKVIESGLTAADNSESAE